MMHTSYHNNKTIPSFRSETQILALFFWRAVHSNSLPIDQKYMTAVRIAPLQNHTGERRIDSAPITTSTYRYLSLWDALTDTSRPLAVCDSRIPSHTWDCPWTNIDLHLMSLRGSRKHEYISRKKRPCLRTSLSILSSDRTVRRIRVCYQADQQ